MTFYLRWMEHVARGVVRRDLVITVNQETHGGLDRASALKTVESYS